MNRVLKYLIASDLLVLSGLNLAAPIMAIFITGHLIGGTIFAAGLATALVFLMRAVFLVPLGIYNDRDAGNRREFVTLVLGILIMAAVPISYIFITRVEHLYLMAIINGIGFTLYYPGWFTIWTRFIDGMHEGQNWSIYGSLASFSIAVSAFAGGYVAQFFSFNAVFVMISIFTFISAFILFFVKKEIYGWQPKGKGSGNRAGV